jgi:hypothetical protein
VVEGLWRSKRPHVDLAARPSWRIASGCARAPHYPHPNGLLNMACAVGGPVECAASQDHGRFGSAPGNNRGNEPERAAKRHGSSRATGPTHAAGPRTRGIAFPKRSSPPLSAQGGAPPPKAGIPRSKRPLVDLAARPSWRIGMQRKHTTNRKFWRLVRALRKAMSRVV